MQYNFNDLEIGGYVDLGEGFKIIMDMSLTKVLVDDIWHDISDVKDYKENRNSAEVLEVLREAYPKGTKVKLLKMDDPQAVPVGTIGTVRFVDDAKQIHVAWETRSSLAVVYGEDKVLKCI